MRSILSHRKQRSNASMPLLFQSGVCFHFSFFLPCPLFFTYTAPRPCLHSRKRSPTREATNPYRPLYPQDGFIRKRSLKRLNDIRHTEPNQLPQSNQHPPYRQPLPLRPFCNFWLHPPRPDSAYLINTPDCRCSAVSIFYYGQGPT